MESEDRFSKMSYEELADFAVLHGVNVPYNAILELVNRGPDKAITSSDISKTGLTGYRTHLTLRLYP